MRYFHPPSGLMKATRFPGPRALATWSAAQMISPELSNAQVAQYFRPQPVPASPPAPLAGVIAQFFGTLNTAVGNALGGIDLKVLLPVTLFFLGIRGMIAEKATPPAWYNLLWFALATFMMFHPASPPMMAEMEALNATVEGVAGLELGD